jgi:hypothetical protein
MGNKLSSDVADKSSFLKEILSNEDLTDVSDWEQLPIIEYVSTKSIFESVQEYWKDYEFPNIDLVYYVKTKVICVWTQHKKTKKHLFIPLERRIFKMISNKYEDMILNVVICLQNNALIPNTLKKIKDNEQRNMCIIDSIFLSLYHLAFTAKNTSTLFPLKKELYEQNKNVYFCTVYNSCIKEYVHYVLRT